MSTLAVNENLAAPLETSVSSQFSTLSEIFAINVDALLCLSGITSTRAPETASPERARWIMASIGFSGESARGALTIVASAELWRKYAATSLTDLSEALLADMAGELANMVLGRTRNDLSRLGVTVHPATPTCAFGEEITFRDPGDAQVRWQRFLSPAGDLFVRLDAHLQASFVLEANGDACVKPFEAEMLLF